MSADRMTARKGSNFEDFTDMLAKLIREVFGDEVTFSEEKPSNTDPEKHPTPYIAYNLEKREIVKGGPVKHNVFGHFEDPDNEGETITPLRKWFDCEVRFSIYARTNRDSRKWAEEFEDFIERYKGLIKNEGVSEILFKGEVSDGVATAYRQDLSVRTLIYNVRIERVTEVRSVEFKRIEASIQTSENSDEREHYVLAEKKKKETLSGVSEEGKAFLELYKQSNHSFQKKEEQ